MSANDQGHTPQTTNSVITLPQCCATTDHLSPFNYGPPITVMVGPAEEDFHFHKSLLRHHSDYFRAAMKDEWAGRNAKELLLPEDDAYTFGLFYHWLYTETLYGHTNMAVVPLPLHDIINVWVYADFRGIPGLCNTALDLMYQKMCQVKVAWPGLIDIVYADTMEGSSIRMLYVDMYIVSTTVETEKPGAGFFPNQFLLDVIYRMSTEGTRRGHLVGKLEEMSDDICRKYHTH